MREEGQIYGGAPPVGDVVFVTIAPAFVAAPQRGCSNSRHVGTNPRLRQRQRAPVQLPIHIRAKETHLLFGCTLRKDRRSSQPWSRNSGGEASIAPCHLFLRKNREDIFLFLVLLPGLHASLASRACPEALLHVPKERFWNFLSAITFQ